MMSWENINWILSVYQFPHYFGNLFSWGGEVHAKSHRWMGNNNLILTVLFRNFPQKWSGSVPQPVCHISLFASSLLISTNGHFMCPRWYWWTLALFLLSSPLTSAFDPYAHEQTAAVLSECWVTASVQQRVQTAVYVAQTDGVWMGRHQPLVKTAGKGKDAQFHHSRECLVGVEG